MSQRIDQLRQAWDERERRMGLTKRAVLFKRFPGWLNESIHRRHVQFVLRNLSRDTRSLLDVGCGYGRMSMEIKRRYPNIVFQGVDLCAEFAAAYEQEIGRCFEGPIQNFESDNSYDVIIIVTTLMYLDLEEHRPILTRLWSNLNAGGCLLCIEPAVDFLAWWRKLTGKASGSPTGGAVYYFNKAELTALVCSLDGSVLLASSSIGMIPLLPVPVLHHAIAVRKEGELQVQKAVA